MQEKPQKTLLDHLDLLKILDPTFPVLDLACGTGRNGLALAQQGLPVVFADKSDSALETVKQHLLQDNLTARLWQINLEQADVNPFAGQNFSAAIVFRYLHRPLFPALLEAIVPGGLVIYETFTTDNRQFGRPNSPDFLLNPGELMAIFHGWEMIHYYEGLQRSPDRAIAQIVARKPKLPGQRDRWNEASTFRRPRIDA